MSYGIRRDREILAPALANVRRKMQEMFALEEKGELGDLVFIKKPLSQILEQDVFASNEQSNEVLEKIISNNSIVSLEDKYKFLVNAVQHARRSAILHLVYSDIAYMKTRDGDNYLLSQKVANKLNKENTF